MIPSKAMRCLLLCICGTLAARIETSALSQADEKHPVFRVKAETCDSLRVMRQGKVVSEQKCQKPYSDVYFSNHRLHQEYIVEANRITSNGMLATWRNPFFIEQTSMCGAGLFTKKERSCAWISSDPPSTLLPHTDRAFGLEFEFVARQSYRWFGFLNPSGAKEQVEDLRKCYSSVLKEKAFNCSSSTECGLDGFCNRNRTCMRRKSCSRSDALEGVCPPRMLWNWETDSSVKPLDLEQAKSVGAGRDETNGVAFELVSPGPPHTLSGQQGFQSFTEVLTGLRHVGVQAGPSQGLHVHVNVVGSAQGEKISLAGIMSIWAAWAKYQLVINEMLSPGRPGNKYANPLYLGQQCASGDSSCKMVKRFFRQMYQFRFLNFKLLSTERSAASDMCNKVLKWDAGNPYPCGSRYPSQRYFQVNLVPLQKYGTLEFRAHSATYDQERVARWVQFLIAFVEHFGAGAGQESMKQYFSAGTWEDGYHLLKEAQLKATSDELFGELEGKVDAGSKAYYASRQWEQENPTCAKSEIVNQQFLSFKNAIWKDSYLCCCHESDCKWFPSSASSKCPQVKMQGGLPQCITRNPFCFLDASCKQFQSSHRCAAPRSENFFTGELC
mmetsp:Transcript_101221/g.179789  ORF Transcript_101221/g.179789 Transcript_101221/m.179789 type:complete len:611 (+) Transcript_101221:48-1880(+)